MMRRGTTSPPDESIITVDGFTKTYSKGGTEVTAVDDISFSIDEGSIVGFLGPNGAGKTTTMKALLDLVIPTSGRVTIHGRRVSEESNDLFHEISGMLEGARNLYWRLTVEENIELFSAMHAQSCSKETVQTLLDRVGLEDCADQQVRNLSRGMKQKAALATLLAKDTPIVVLDEPTLGLDVQAELQLREEIRTLANELNKTILVSSHNMDMIQAVCDRVIIMNRGEIIADDRIENLVEVFDIVTYTVRLGLEDKFQVELLENEFRVVDVESIVENERIELTVRITENDEIQALIDRLLDQNVTIEAIETSTPDLRDVFLRMTDDGTDPEDSKTTIGAEV